MPDGFSSVLYPYCTLIYKKCKSAFEFIEKKLVTKLSRKSNVHVSRVDFTEGCRATCHSERSEESPFFSQSVSRSPLADKPVHGPIDCLTATDPHSDRKTKTWGRQEWSALPSQLLSQSASVRERYMQVVRHR